MVRDVYTDVLKETFKNMAKTCAREMLLFAQISLIEVI